MTDTFANVSIPIRVACGAVGQRRDCIVEGEGEDAAIRLLVQRIVASIDLNVSLPSNPPDSYRDAKGQVSRMMRNRHYSPMVDQASLTERFDIMMARSAVSVARNPRSARSLLIGRSGRRLVPWSRRRCGALRSRGWYRSAGAEPSGAPRAYL